MLAGVIVFLSALPSALGDGSKAMGASDQVTEKAEGAGLEVSEIETWVTDPAEDNLRVWVDVTNPGTEPAVNLTAHMRGAEPVFETAQERYSHSASVSRGGSTSESFGVIPRTNLTVGASMINNGPRSTISLSVQSPAGNTFSGQGSGTSQRVTIPRADVDADVFGEWTTTVTHTGGILPISYIMELSFVYTDAAQNLTLDELPAGETYPFYFIIHAKPGEVPPTFTITVNGTVVEGGVETRVSYIARASGAVEELPVVPTSTPGGGDMGAAAVAVIVVIVFGTVGAYGWVRRGWRPAQLLRVLKRKPPEPPAAPPPQQPE